MSLLRFLHRMVHRLIRVRLKFKEDNSTSTKATAYLEEFSRFGNRLIYLRFHLQSNLEVVKLSLHSHRTKQNLQAVKVPEVPDGISRTYEYAYIGELKDGGHYSVVLTHKSGVLRADLPKCQQRTINTTSIEKQYRIKSIIESTQQTSDPVTVDISSIAVSILIPVYLPERKHLKSCFESIVNQSLRQGFEVIVCVDQIQEENRDLLSDFQNEYGFVVIEQENRLNISGNLNKGLGQAKGEYCLFLDQDDTLADNALERVVDTIQQKNPDVIYSDEDKINEDGQVVRPVFKPDYSPFYLRGCNYINHLLVVKTSIGQDIGWFKTGMEGAQDHDLLLRLTERTADFYHIPEVLYHWRMTKMSTARNFDVKDYALNAGINAIRGHLQRLGMDAHVSKGKRAGEYNWRSSVSSHFKCLILRTSAGDFGKTRKGLLELLDSTNYSDFSVLQLCDSRSKERFRQEFGSEKRLMFEVVKDNGSNISDLLTMPLEDASYDLTGFVDASSKALSADWLANVVDLFRFKKTGVVGSKLVTSTGRLVHAGLVAGMCSQRAGAFMAGMNDGHPGYFRKDVVREVYAVAPNGMFFRNELLDKTLNKGRMLSASGIHLEICAVARSLNYAVLCHPGSCFEVGESGLDIQWIGGDRQKRMQDPELYCGDADTEVVYEYDPFFNPNLSLKSRLPMLRFFEHI